MASRDKIFLDTDVALDHQADRQPFAEYAHRIFALALLGKLKLLVRVSAAGETEIQAALSSRFKDFEDAIQHFAAKAEGGISTIVTRNTADYSASEIPVCRRRNFSRSTSQQSNNFTLYHG